LALWEIDEGYRGKATAVVGGTATALFVAHADDAEEQQRLSNADRADADRFELIRGPRTGP